MLASGTSIKEYSSKLKATEADFYNSFASLNIPQVDGVLKDETDTPVSKADLLGGHAQT